MSMGCHREWSSLNSSHWFFHVLWFNTILKYNISSFYRGHASIVSPASPAMLPLMDRLSVRLAVSGCDAPSCWKAPVWARRDQEAVVFAPFLRSAPPPCIPRGPTTRATRAPAPVLLFMTWILSVGNGWLRVNDWKCIKSGSKWG